MGEQKNEVLGAKQRTKLKVYRVILTSGHMIHRVCVCVFVM